MNEHEGTPTTPPRRRRKTILAVVAASALGLTGLAFGAGIGLASGQSAKVVTITVTAGKPSEFGFTVSKNSNVPLGKVIFKVTNKGVIGHSFKVCSRVSAAALANACIGTSTKVLQKGQTALLVVTFTKAGKYEFLCTVSGHAANGMKGLIGVGVSAPPPGKTTSTTGTTTTAKGSCASPATTSISVSMVDYAFTGVPGSLPCGTVNVTEVNNGQQDHNISFQGSGVTGGVGPVIGPGQSSTFSMTINPGTYPYQCDVGDHAAQGMAGSVTVH
jgi:nitrite reductase (NO-forming)